jgi:hypothetical protein
MKILSHLLALCVVGPATALQNLNDLPRDLTPPAVHAGAPAAGQRVLATTAGWAGGEVHHTLYLPRDWTAQKKKSWPVIVEYPGNGGFKNSLGDTSDGSVEGCVLGYGLSAGEGFIWVSMPFIETPGDGPKRNAIKWWGSVEETKRYTLATVRDVCQRYNGDARRVVLAGFSRGAIACNYIGLHDAEISALWCAFFCHSHYDGVKENWGYPQADRASALTRLQRLANRPQWISHEGTTSATEAWLREAAVPGRYTFAALPFANHSAAWTLCDLPLRTQARTWLHAAVSP